MHWSLSHVGIGTRDSMSNIRTVMAGSVMMSLSSMGSLLQIVGGGVYLLTPSKRAYLRYYKDLEDDIMGNGRHQPMDIESLMPTAADRKFASHKAAAPLGDDGDEVSSTCAA